MISVKDTAQEFSNVRVAWFCLGEGRQSSRLMEPALQSAP